MENGGIILEYKVHLTFSTIGMLLTMLKHKMVQDGIKIGVYKRIMSVMIEALENVYKNFDSYQSSPIIRKNFLPEFQLKRNDARYYISVSNPVKNADTEKLAHRLDLVNSKSPDELRILYRQTITDGKFSEKGGAGLGIIEIAKISGNPLQYSFTPIDQDYSFYTLKITFD